MLSALLNLVASMGALSVLAGVISGVIFLVDSVLHWASAQRTSLDPSWPGAQTAPTVAVNGTNGAAHPVGNGIGNGKAAALTDSDWFIDSGPQLIRVPLQTLDVTLKSSRSARLGAGDGLAHSDAADMGEADDVHDVPDVPDGPAGVRQLMERLVESLVSGGLDDVALRPKDPHPQYGRIYKRHQPRLRSALTSLAYSLQMAMAQKPLAECETPGRAHAQLRALILDLAKDVAALDRHAAHADECDSLVDLDVQDLASRAYEDILATAIVNKVMERSNKNIKRNNNNNFVSSLEVRVGGSVDDSPESCTSSFTESWTGSSSHLDHSLEDVDSDPLSLMIEECIEEVTTITATSSSSSAASSSLDERSEGDEDEVRQVPVVRRRRRRSSRRRGSGGASLSGPPSLPLSFLKQRVPFPELGVDIVDAEWSSGESVLSETAEEHRNGDHYGPDAEGWPHANGGDAVDGAADANGEATDEERPASCLELVTPLQSWEDNWLFQSKRIRKPAAQYAHHPVPVPMLVPNPSEDFRALIGDVDAEETSDLSECSDDALEELVLAGMRPNGTANGSGSDQFSEDVSLSEATNRNFLDGLAETCNLELLRRAAPALSTAPAPKAQRTDRSANHGKPSATPDRLSPTGRSATPTLSPGRRSPADLAGRWARDQDAEMTIVYDTPTRREAPTRAKASKGTPTITPKATPRKEETPQQDRSDAKSESAAAAAAATSGQPAAEAGVGPAAVSQPAPEGPREPKLDADGPEQEGHVDDRVSTPTNGIDDPSLFTPPRPGTIAEREHRKWLEATPLANNPYSPENIQRRLQQRASQGGPVDLPPALTATIKGAAAAPGLPPPTDASLHIALRVDPDPKKYGRDFYINSRNGDQSGAGLRRAHSVTAVDRKNSLLESPIAPWSAAVRTNGDGGSEESALPSVRELAKQFVGQPQEAAAPHAQHGQHQVHSLTARSMSREFREGLRHLSNAGRAPAPTPQGLLTRTPSTTPLAGAEQPAGRPDPEGARQPADPE